MTASGRRSGDLICVDDDVFGVGTAGVVDRHHYRHHAVTDADAGASVRADFVDGPGDLHAWAVRRGQRAGTQCTVDVADPQQRIGGVDRRGVHPDAESAGAGMGLVDVHLLQNLRAAVLGDHYCSHDQTS